MTTIPTSSAPTPSIISNNLVGNLNTSEIITALLQPYETQETNVKNQNTAIATQVSDYQAINTDVASLKTAAQGLASSPGWGATQAVSSDSTTATATAASGTPSGSVSFIVKNLASAQTLTSAGTVASTNDVVTQASNLLLSVGGSQYGFQSLDSGSGLTLGSHTVQVTQASQAAQATGNVDLSSTSSGLSVGSGSDTLNVSVNGTAYNLSIGASPTGGYSGAGLLSAVQSAISTAGAGSVLQAGYNSSGNLVLSTVNQGSSQSLQVTSGTALQTLGLATQATAATGTDADVTVDGTANTLTDVSAGGTFSLNSGSGGTISATVATPASGSATGASLLSVGTVSATDVSTGNGSLGDVVSNINNASAGITASAVETGNNQYVMQLSSGQTGTSGDMSVDLGSFSSSPLGQLQVVTAGTDAQIEIGGGSGYTLSSQTNTFTGLLPGLSVTALQQSDTAVTITTSPDATAVSEQVQALVDSANQVLSDISSYAGYDASTKTAGPLMGSAALQTLNNQIQGIVASVEGTSTLGNGEGIGLTLSNGQIEFNQNTFEAAYNANPQQVANMFVQGGSFQPASSQYTGQVTMNSATNNTNTGSYAVDVSQSATQATDDGNTLGGGTVSTAEQLSVTEGANTIGYATTAGESLSDIATGLNAALAGAGMDMSAQLINGGTQLQLTSSDYGSQASFSVTSSETGSGTTGLGGSTSGTASSFTGTDVAGSINGVAATGVGQYLDAPSTDPTLAGLSLQVTATGITSSTNLGNFTYQPGIAQQLTTLATTMADPNVGELSTTIQGLQNQETTLTSQVAFYAEIVAQQQTSLTNQYANLEAQLSTLSDQSTALTSQISSLAANDPASTASSG